MSYVQLSEGGFQVVYALACCPGSPELSKSYMHMASKLFTFAVTRVLIVCSLHGQSGRGQAPPRKAKAQQNQAYQRPPQTPLIEHNVQNRYNPVAASRLRCRMEPKLNPENIHQQSHPAHTPHAPRAHSTCTIRSNQRSPRYLHWREGQEAGLTDGWMRAGRAWSGIGWNTDDRAGLVWWRGRGRAWPHVQIQGCSARTAPRHGRSFTQSRRSELAAQGGPVDHHGALAPVPRRECMSREPSNASI